MRIQSLKIAVLATFATIVPAATAFAGDPSQWG
jgi:hypothetical protein